MRMDVLPYSQDPPDGRGAWFINSKGLAASEMPCSLAGRFKDL